MATRKPLSKHDRLCALAAAKELIVAATNDFEGSIRLHVIGKVIASDIARAQDMAKQVIEAR